jgi:hypothetical protein
MKQLITILSLSYICLNTFAQTPYGQMRENLLKNIWTDADYELYLAPVSKLKKEKPFFTVPAYYLPLSDSTKQLISATLVFCPNANSVYVNGKKQFIDTENRSVFTTLKDGKLLLPAKYLYPLLGKQRPKKENEIVDIEIVATKSGKKCLKNDLGLLFVADLLNPQIAKASRQTQYEILYNTLYERPKRAKVVADVIGHTGKKHPYILADAKRFEEIKTLIRTDSFARTCYEKVLASANKVLNEDVDIYEFKNPQGGIFATIKNSPTGKVLDLGIAYRVTGEKKYAERAIQELLSVASWPDWGCTLERQFLGTGAVATGMGLGFDWFYNEMTSTQRQTIREAIVAKAIHPGLFYHTVRHANRFVLARHNWNAVGNGGLIIASLAIAADEPELAGRLLEFSIGSFENVLSIYAPKGDYEEGPGYWAYGTGSLVNAMAAIESATGKTYGLSDAPGVDKTAYFTPYMIGPNGYFNFHDSDENGKTYITDPEYFWFANRFANPDFYWERMYLPEQHKGGAKDLLWYKGESRGAFNLKLDYMGSGENNAVGTGTFRSSWTDPNALFLGFHAGYRLANHAQADEGNFIFDAIGERWIMDVGYGSHDTTRSESYFQAARPLFYRMRTEAHNTYVVNPDKSYGQDFSSDNRPQFENVVMQPDKAYAIANLTCSYKGQVSSAKRGFMLNRQNNYALVQDEVTLTQPSTVYWFLHTRANIKLIEKDQAAIFTIGTKRLYVKLIGNTTGAKWSVMPAKSLSPGMVEMKNMDDVRKLAIKFEGISNMNFAAMLVPLKDGENKPYVQYKFEKMDSWK